MISDRPPPRWLSTAALLAWVTLAPAACAPDRERAETPSAAGTAVLGVDAGATTVLPPLAAAALDFELGGALYLALNVGVWEEGSLTFPEGHPLALARSWSLDEETATLTYRLDPNRRWSDGRPIRASDVVFTYELLGDTSLALPLSSTTERLDSVVAVDDTTAVFHFDDAYPGMLFDTGVGILPAHVFGAIPREAMRGLPGLEDRDPAELVVSGPFRLDGWEPTDRIVLTRNPASSSPARLDRLVVRIIPDETTRIAELRSGAVDVARLNSFRTARALEADGGIRLLRVPQRGYDFIAWNPEAHPAFADPSVRRAFSIAFDRQAWIDGLDMSGFAVPAYGPYGSLFADLASAPFPDGDVERSSRLLAEAGWVDADGDGVRERDGRRLEFELATAAGNERRESAVQIVQRRLDEIGARANLRTEEFRALLGRAMAGDYEAALLGWQVGLDPDISVFWEAGSPLNLVSFSDGETAALIDSARAQTTAAAAAPFWRRVGARISDLHPYAFLWFFDLPLAVGPRIEGVEAPVTGFGSSLPLWWRREPDRD